MNWPIFGAMAWLIHWITFGVDICIHGLGYCVAPIGGSPYSWGCIQVCCLFHLSGDCHYPGLRQWHMILHLCCRWTYNIFDYKNFSCIMIDSKSSFVPNYTQIPIKTNTNLRKKGKIHYINTMPIKFAMWTHWRMNSNTCITRGLLVQMIDGNSFRLGENQVAESCPWPNNSIDHCQTFTNLLYNLWHLIQVHKLNALQWNKIFTHVPMQITCCFKKYPVLQIDPHFKTY
jgi:hypothetical protein